MIRRGQQGPVQTERAQSSASLTVFSKPVATKTSLLIKAPEAKNNLATSSQTASNSSAFFSSQSKPTRALPTPPVKSSNTNSARSATASNSVSDIPLQTKTVVSTAVVKQTEQTPIPYVCSATKKKYDLHEVLDFLGESPDLYPQIVKYMQDGSFDITESIDGTCNSAFESAAHEGATKFFEFVMNDPLIRPRININVINTATNSTPLAYAIKGGRFDLALSLIEDYGANVHLLMGDITYGTNDNTVSMLRIALSCYFTKSFDGYSDDQKKSLEKLIQKLLDMGLRLFTAPNSHCPPTIILAKNRSGVSPETIKERMQYYGMSTQQYYLYNNLLILYEESPITFQMIIAEAKIVKQSGSTNPAYQQARDILELCMRDKIEIIKNERSIGYAL